MEWIIKANLNLLLFGLIYQLVLHFSRQYTLERIYLLLTPLLSIVLPLYLSMEVTTQNTFTYLLKPVVVGASDTSIPATSYSVFDVLTVVYVGGVVLSLLRFVISLIQLLFFMKIQPTAYSFFNRIVIPSASPDNAEMMRFHEEAHVKEQHSIDMIYYQFIKAFFWFNPVTYRMFLQLKEVHEFSADAYAVQHIENKVSYCELLLDETFGVQTHGLIHPFHSKSTILNRIHMITQNQRQPVSRWKYLAILPMLAAIVLLSATPKDAVAQDKKEKVHTGQDLPEVMPEFKGGQDAMMKYLGKELNYPADARKEKVEGRVIVKFVVNKDGSISKVETLKENDSRLAKEAVRVVKAMPVWNPGKKDGNPVAVEFILPVSFKLN
jgi:TonB family protein